MHRGSSPMMILALALLPTGARAESVVVTLKSGGRVEGGLISESEGELVVRLAHGSIRVPRRDVKSVERGPDAPRPAAPPSERLPGWNHVIEVILAEPQGPSLRQIPATVIEVGPLARVPYVSHRFGALELNVYGDPDHPAGYEVGIVQGAGASEAGKRDCLRVARALLPADADRLALDALSLTKDRREAKGLVLEVTPPEAEDSYGGWWVSIYDPAGLERARASAAELEAITAARGAEDKDDPLAWTKDDYARARPARKTPPRPAPPARPQPEPAPPPPVEPEPAAPRVSRRGYYREDGTFVPRRRRR